MHPITTPVIVLRLTDYGEADRIVTLLGRVTGKVSALARGARASRRRFGPALALFATGDATLVERRGAELFRLDGFEARSDPSRLAADLGRFAHAGYAVELLRELSPAGEPHPSVYDLGRWFLEALDARGPRAERLRYLELRLLEELGIGPSLDRCASCGSQDLEGTGETLDPSRGGVVCARCTGGSVGGEGFEPGRRGGGKPEALNVVPLPAAARVALARLQRARPDEVEEMALGEEEGRAARDAMRVLVLGHVGKPLRSLAFLEKMNRALRER